MCLSLSINYLVATRTDNDDIILHDYCGICLPSMSVAEQEHIGY